MVKYRGNGSGRGTWKSLKSPWKVLRFSFVQNCDHLVCYNDVFVYLVLAAEAVSSQDGCGGGAVDNVWWCFPVVFGANSP